MSQTRSIAALVTPDLPVALARRRHPELAGRPLAVARDHTLIALSPEARAEGLYAGMAAEQARRRATVVLLDRHALSRARGRAAALLGGYSPRVEAQGGACWYVDLSGTEGYFRRAAVDLVAEAAARLETELGAAVRAGLAGGKAVARMAAGTDSRLTRILAGGESDFLAGLPVDALPGLRRHDRQRLHQLGLTRVGEVARAPAQHLTSAFGPGARLWQQWGRGWDPRPVIPGGPEAFREALPVADYQSLGELAPLLFGAAERLGRRLRERRERARRLRAGLEFRDGAERGRLARVEPTDHDLTLYEAFHGLTAAAWNRRVALVRIILEITERGSGGQGELFGDERPGDSLLRSIDAVRDRFGPEAVRWGRQL